MWLTRLNFLLLAAPCVAACIAITCGNLHDWGHEAKNGYTTHALGLPFWYFREGHVQVMGVIDKEQPFSAHWDFFALAIDLLFLSFPFFGALWAIRHVVQPIPPDEPAESAPVEAPAAPS